MQQNAIHKTDEEYFRSCVAKERRLALLLGHKVEEFYESAGTLWDGDTPLPKWARDWNACGLLLAQYELPISYMKTEQGQTCAVTVGRSTAQLNDHPSKQQALMFATVTAVIAALEHRQH